MSVFMLGPEDESRIKNAAAKARETPVSLDMLTRAAQSGVRPKDAPEPQEIRLEFGWRVNISAEEQPFGMVLHLSMSSPTPKTTLPRAEAMEMVLETLGYQGLHNLAAEPWIEDFTEAGKPAGKAVNVIVPVMAS